MGVRRGRDRRWRGTNRRTGWHTVDSMSPLPRRLKDPYCARVRAGIFRSSTTVGIQVVFPTGREIGKFNS